MRINLLIHYRIHLPTSQIVGDKVECSVCINADNWANIYCFLLPINLFSIQLSSLCVAFFTFDYNLYIRYL